MKSWLVRGGIATLYDEGRATETKVQMSLEAVGAGLAKAKELKQPIVVAMWPGLCLLFPVGEQPTNEEMTCGARQALWGGVGKFFASPVGCFLSWDVPKKAPAATVLQNRQEARQVATKAIKDATRQINIREVSKAEFAAQAADVPDYPVMEEPEDYGF